MFRFSTQMKVTLGFIVLLLLIVLSVGLVYREMSLATNSNEHEMAYADSVSAQLQRKEQHIDEVLRAMKAMYRDSEYLPGWDRVMDSRDTLSGVPLITRKTTTVTQHYVVRQKKNLFKRIHDVFAPGKGDTVRMQNVSTTQETDSIPVTYPSEDSVRHLLKAVQGEAEARHHQKIRQLNCQVKKLKADGAAMNRQTGQLIRMMEEENRLLVKQQTENFKSARWHSVQTLGWIAIIALLLAGIFLFVILRDIARSNRYKRQLEQANAETSRLLAEREQLMLTVTHDIKAPVGSILGYADLLNRITRDDRQHTYLASIEASAQHLLRMVTSLLDYHQLDARKVKVDPVNFQPVQLFDAVYRSFQPLAARKKLRLDYACAPILECTFLGDAFRIRQITENLLSNALKFTDKGTISLRACFREGCLCFSVGDTGPGISPEEQQKIYDEFTRLPNAQGHEGFGLGLSITRQLVRLMQGTITVKSRLGEGSLFQVSIPLRAAANMTENEVPVHRLRVLVMDDDPLQLQLTEAMLASKGIVLTTSLHPLEVSMTLRNGDYDAIVTDVQMPEMSGFDFVQHIHKAGIVIPVYALTARSDIQTEDLRKHGFDGCLHKPFTAEELLATVTNRQSGTVVSKRTSIDFGSLTAFAGDDEEAACHILQTFVAETQKNRLEMMGALQKGDVRTITALAHKMLPVFMQIGASDGIEALSWLERQQGQNIVTEEMELYVRQVFAVSAQLMTRAEAWMKK